jgi:hypothetical protein
MEHTAPESTYTSTVVARGPALLVILATLVLLGWVTGSYRNPSITILTGVLAGVLVVAPALHLAAARLVITPTAIGLASGVRGRTRWIALDQVTEYRAEQPRWPQVYGLGLPQSWRLTRLLVRPGPALRLRLVDGEQVWISTRDTDTAVRLLDRYATEAGGGRNESRRSLPHE